MPQNTKPLETIAGAPDKPLAIGDIEIPCYVLNDETRVLTQRHMIAGIGLRSGGGSSGANTKVPRFFTSNTLKPFIPEDVMKMLANPIPFTTPKGREAFGYPAIVLPRICEVVLSAHDKGKLLKSQQHIVTQCSLIMRGLAMVGIIALVDEATGYQRIRGERALAIILEKFIAKELQPWTKTFPYEFYQGIYKLKGWDGPYGNRRPAVIGRYTNDIVYKRLAPSVLEELQRKNPVLPRGHRATTHHQWLTPELGHPKLKEHLAAVIAYMNASKDWAQFIRRLNRFLPRQNETMPLPYDEPEDDDK